MFLATAKSCFVGEDFDEEDDGDDGAKLIESYVMLTVSCSCCFTSFSLYSRLFSCFYLFINFSSISRKTD